MSKESNSPVNQVLRSLTFGLLGNPNLKVFGSIVRFNSVNVMDVLKGFQSPAKGLFHHDAVLENGLSVFAFSNVPVFTLNVPANVSASAHNSFIFNIAFLRAKFNFAVRLAQKVITALRAFLANTSRHCSTFVLTLFAAIVSTLSVGSFCLKFLATQFALFRNSWCANNSIIPSVYSTRHGSLRVYGEVRGIVPKGDGFVNVRNHLILIGV